MSVFLARVVYSRLVKLLVTSFVGTITSGKQSHKSSNINLEHGCAKDVTSRVRGNANAIDRMCSVKVNGFNQGKS